MSHGSTEWKWPRQTGPETLAWNAAATASNPDSKAEQFEAFDISQFLESLKPGANVLAIQLMNSSASGSDALAVPRLVGNTGSFGGRGARSEGVHGLVSPERRHNSHRTASK